MRKLIKKLLPFKTVRYGLVRALYNAERNLYIIGIYDNSTFSGTDKLSMAVQPDFINFTNKTGATILFEGDRLFNQSLFDKVNCEKIVIQTTDETKEARHKKRNDSQSEQFKKSKKTKIQNILQNNSVTILNNDAQEEHNAALKHIIQLIK
tara:strand:+ start:484 stop:936 length:453 start_codon:yes stop_codon:yes gene_type:complete